MLKHLVGQSYCLETPAASLGLYLGADKHCILIDSGAVADGQQVVSILQKQGWEVSALINTHAHVDHSGANRIIADTFGATVYASAAEKAFLENPWLAPYILFSAHPPRSLANRFIVPRVTGSPLARVRYAGDQWRVLGHCRLGRSYSRTDRGHDSRRSSIRRRQPVIQPILSDFSLSGNG